MVAAACWRRHIRGKLRERTLLLGKYANSELEESRGKGNKRNQIKFENKRESRTKELYFTNPFSRWDVTPQQGKNNDSSNKKESDTETTVLRLLTMFWSIIGRCRDTKPDALTKSANQPAAGMGNKLHEDECHCDCLR
ncbi:hypothetical protein CDAR_42291 [Caerostris darwini]|uniref:Uncharacterized protein n=1 Tax=Caerostris darwini TaxID=1538125 RepID=A0AAV4RK07_9ARAC|nr:hypothetical protein CDAR_42291 [Caerostris darwini]